VAQKKQKNKMRKTIILGMFALIVLTFGACTKAKDGAPGATGPTGANGVANISSQIISVTPGSWSSSGSGFWSYSVYESDITNSDLDAVMVYYYAGSSQYLAMPISGAFVSGDNLTFSFLPNQINLLYINATAPTTTTSYRVVVIPPALIKPNVDYKNYSAVQSAYNL
jgi:hypothetical protein